MPAAQLPPQGRPVNPNAPRIGGMFSGVASLGVFTAFDYAISRAMGQDASLLKSVGTGLLWTALGPLAGPIGVATVGTELMSLGREIVQGARAERAIASMHHLSGSPGFYLHDAAENLQEMGLRRLMNNRRALGMAFGSEASFLHRA